MLSALDVLGTYQQVVGYQWCAVNMYQQVMLGASDVLFGMYQQATLGASVVLIGMYQQVMLMC